MLSRQRNARLSNDRLKQIPLTHFIDCANNIVSGGDIVVIFLIYVIYIITINL